MAISKFALRKYRDLNIFKFAFKKSHTENYESNDLFFLYYNNIQLLIKSYEYEV